MSELKNRKQEAEEEKVVVLDAEGGLKKVSKDIEFAVVLFSIPFLGDANSYTYLILWASILPSDIKWFRKSACFFSAIY